VRRRDRLTATLAAAAVVLTGVGCTEPVLQDVEEGEPAEDPTPDPSEPDREALTDDLGELSALLEQVRTELARAADATAPAEARAAGAAARALLIDDPTRPSGAAAALFPSVSADRGAVDDRTDLFTRLLTAAREAGGTLGGATLELLRDPLAGDLGAWEQDPEGLLAGIQAVARPGVPLDELDVEVLGLDGDGARAIAWVLLLEDTPDLELAAAYAERADLHTELVLMATDSLLAGEGDAGTTGDDPGDADSGPEDDGPEDGSDPDAEPGP
jgi:hypothetical protein